MKKILMCIPESAGAAGTGFEMKVVGVAGKRISSVCRDGESLEVELRKPWGLYNLAILFAGSIDDLEQYILFHELLEGIPVLLVLPASGRDICKRAHLLRPRFISFTDGDFSDFCAVLQKMIRNQEQALQRAGEKMSIGK